MFSVSSAPETAVRIRAQRTRRTRSPRDGSVRRRSDRGSGEVEGDAIEVVWHVTVETVPARIVPEQHVVIGRSGEGPMPCRRLHGQSVEEADHFAFPVTKQFPIERVLVSCEHLSAVGLRRFSHSQISLQHRAKLRFLDFAVRRARQRIDEHEPFRDLEARDARRQPRGQVLGGHV